jgi:hypothetical protein
MVNKTIKGGYFVIHASFNQIIELTSNKAQVWENAVNHLINNEGAQGIRVRFWDPDSGNYMDRRVFMYGEPLPPANQKPNKAAHGKAGKRNRKDESDEQHVRSHFGGLYLETEEDAEKVKALVVSNFSQDFL